MSRPENGYLFKAVSIGKEEAGKSQYLLKLTENRFSTAHDMTIGVEFGSKQIDLGNKSIKFQLWDTSGHGKFISIIKQYFRRASLFALFVDLSEKNLINPDVESDSIQFLHEHIDLSNHFTPIELLKQQFTLIPLEEETITPQCFVIFTKNDLAKENGIQLSEEQLQNLATQAMEAAQVPKENRIPGQFIVTSAKTGENIEETLPAFANALLPLPAPTLKAFVLPKTEESQQEDILIKIYNSIFSSSKKEDDKPPQEENHFTF